MSGLISSDPLAILAMEAGLIRAPLSEAAAQGDSQLDSPQRAAVIGEPVPVVFCRRDEAAGSGGVLISPPATEARFSNDASNAVTASYHLVLSEGLIGSIQVRDVFQRACRVGTHTQTYNRRAGTWTPGNFVTAQTGYTMPECPYYCGTVGVYSGMSTMSFTVTIPDGSDQWNRQVHAFIRNGLYVQRLTDGVVGGSNNFADLVNWALLNCAKLPVAQIDYDSLLGAARFLAANAFNCDIAITQSQNLGDMLASMAPYFLLAETRNQGRRGLRPLLPVNANGTIRTTAVPWAYTITEDHVLADSLRISYVPPADRRPFAVRTIWRQQLTDDVGIIRTSEVRFGGEAEDGPYEQHDLSEFCTRENHAVKVAAYIRARRRYVTHTATVAVRTIDFPQSLVPGDVVRLRLDRITDIAADGAWDYLYQIDRITKTAAGDVSLDLTHFPIDSSGRSLVALAVANATGTGILLTSNRTGVTCDVNSSSDTTVPAEAFQTGTAADSEVTMTPAAEDTPGDVAGETSCASWRRAGVMISDVQWDGLDLVITVEMTPRGMPPETSLGDFEVTLVSGTVIAYDANDRPVVPQPATLPSLNMTGVVAHPWDWYQAEDPDLFLWPFPPADYRFSAEFRVTFQESDFPQTGDEAVRYDMPITITNPQGGYCSTPRILNEGEAVFGIQDAQVSWDLAFTNPCSAGPWVVSNENKTIRYNIEDSTNCGGTCSSVQSGVATATITVPAAHTLRIDFDGMIERQNAGFDRISFVLDGVTVATAASEGAGAGCTMGAPIKNIIVPGSYLLEPGVHTLVITFTTGDALYHNDAYYEVDLIFTRFIT